MNQFILTSALPVIILMFPISIGFLYIVRKQHQKSYNANRTKLTHLPNELLLSILSRIPEIDLLRQVPLVCTRFAQLSSLTLAQRRVLWIEFKYGFIESFFPWTCHKVYKMLFEKPGSILKFNKLTQEKCRKIVEIYSNVRQLTVKAKIDSTHQLDEAITGTLLANGNWCDQLESLRLNINFVRPNHENNPEEAHAQEIIRGGSIRRLIILNQRMRSLRRLSITSGVSLGTEPLHLPIIAQLELFGFYTHDNTNLIYPSLIKYGACAESTLKRIEVTTNVMREDRLVNLITNISTSSPNCLHINEDDFNNQCALLSKFTIIDLFECPVVELERLESFFSPRVLSNLNKLTVTWLLQDPLIHLIRALVPFTNDKTKFFEYSLSN